MKGILESTATVPLPSVGRIELVCADGDRFPDYLRHQLQVCGDGRCCHTLTRNGGPLSLAKDSPLAVRNNIPHGEAYLAEIGEACDLKNTTEIFATCHFPCGMAQAYSLSVIEVLQLLCKAKDRIRDSINGANITTLVHVDYAGHRERRFSTYFFNRIKFEQWLKQQEQPLVA